MTGSWLDPIAVQGSVPHRILVVSDDREDYYGTVRLCLDQGQNMEVIFRTYEQVPEQGVFDVVILFCPRVPRQVGILDGILARGQCRGRILAVDGAPAAGQGDERVRPVGRLEFPGVVRGLLSGAGREP